MTADKTGYSERDICTKYITPAIEAAGWDLMTQVREEVTFTNGRVIVKGRTVTRGKQKRADYVLYYKQNIPIALIEAKANNHSVGAGMPQGLGYAETMNIPFVFSSNGDAFLFHDRTPGTQPKERELALDAFPSPEELWERYRTGADLPEPTRAVVEQDFHSDSSGKAPRYYQLNAVNRTIEAIARGQNRVLLVMATGTGKTYTAFQTIWRPRKSRTKRRILFLADRNILVDRCSRVVRLVDPRGSFGDFRIHGDPRYDLAKLSHSVSGDYDFLSHGLFDLDFDGPNVHLTTHTTERHHAMKRMFNQWLQPRWGDWSGQIRLIESLLFLSMVPLHKDRPDCQKAFLARDLELFAQVVRHESAA